MAELLVNHQREAATETCRGKR